MYLPTHCLAIAGFGGCPIFEPLRRFSITRLVFARPIWRDTVKRGSVPRVSVFLLPWLWYVLPFMTTLGLSSGFWLQFGFPGLLLQVAVVGRFSARGGAPVVRGAPPPRLRRCGSWSRSIVAVQKICKRRGAASAPRRANFTLRSLDPAPGGA